MMRRDDDRGIAAVIGAIIILAILGIALVYVNAFYMPRQGAALEVDAAERAEAGLVDLAATLALAPNGPVTHDVPLALARAAPPLMSGIVLSPARVGGTLAFDAAPSSVTISVVVPAPAGGVPAGDPTRESVAGGLMRVYLVGSATSAQPLGAIRATTGGAYAPNSTAFLEGGAVLADTTSASVPLAAPTLHVEGNALTWRLPLLAGSAAEVSGATSAQVSLSPGPEAELGGGSIVREARIKIDTTRLAAWQSALEDVVGARGTVTTASAGADAGSVTATLNDVQLRLFLVRYQVSLAERAV